MTTSVADISRDLKKTKKPKSVALIMVKDVVMVPVTVLAAALACTIELIVLGLISIPIFPFWLVFHYIPTTPGDEVDPVRWAKSLFQKWHESAKKRAQGDGEE